MPMNRSIMLIVAVALLPTFGCGRNRDPQADTKVVMAIRESGGKSTAGATGPVAPVGDGWGTLKGVFVLDGTPLSLPNLSTGGKDGQVCDAHPIPDQSLVVDAQSKGIANIVVYAKKALRVEDSVKDPPKETAVFDQKECVFLTHVLAVRVGQPVAVKNSDPVGHNTNVSATGDSVGTGNVLLAGGTEAAWKFGRAQSDPVVVACNIHPWMKAYIMPRNDPYFAVTAKDGSFTIEKLPAGEEMEFQVWQERKGRTLDGTSEQVKLVKGQFRVTMPKDGVRDLGKITISAAAFQ